MSWDKDKIKNSDFIDSSINNQIINGVKIKTIEGLSQRQAARILGVSPNLIFKV